MITQNIAVNQNADVVITIVLAIADTTKRYLVQVIADGQSVLNKATDNCGGKDEIVVHEGVSLVFTITASQALLLSAVQVIYKVFEIPSSDTPIQLVDGSVAVTPLEGTVLPTVSLYNKVSVRRNLDAADLFQSNDYLILCDTDYSGLDNYEPFPLHLYDPNVMPGKEILVKRLGRNNVDITCEATGQAFTLNNDGDSLRFISAPVTGHDDQFTWYAFNN